ncbi:MAG: tetratricopeptide repeat protein [Bacteroidota bacterium]
MSHRKAYRLLGWPLIIVLIFTMASCSTKKNSFTRRMFHNLTSHYNVYWNGKEALIEAQGELENAIQDNYNIILPMYNYGDEATAKTITPLLDRAIEKGSKTILKHSMRFGGKEYVKWIDDAYLLIGKAYFYKRDYFSARRSFSFIMREYEDYPIKYHGMLWLARTYIEMGQFEKSEPLLNLIQSDISDEQNVPHKVFEDLPLVSADQYIKQENYNYAVDYLYDVIGGTAKKDLKTRARFILAQIYQMENKLDDASRLYTEVIRRNPPYEMAFQSKINLARTYEAENGDSKTIIKYLSRMLRDDKNTEFLDQIYFALAEVALKDHEDSLGIDYLRLSVARSVNNDYQKSTSALKLADIYFEVPEYELSQAYYDTAVSILPEDYPDYEEIKNKAEKLSDLVTNLQIVLREDSLLMLSSMSESARFKIIDEIIQDLREEEKRQREAEQFQQNLLAYGQDLTGGSYSSAQPIGGAKWYFYNTNTMSSGYSEFVRKWGSRKLEDLWRLKDKQQLSFEEDPFQDELDSLALAGDTVGILALDPHNREYYLKDIPFTDEEIAESNHAIAQALYNLGLIYSEGLHNFEKSIESYEELIDRYPEDQNKLKVFYQLYRLYLDMGNTEKSEYYKNIIINDYPESDYAMIIIDPDYYKNMKAKESELTVLYSKTYKAFERGQYFTVITNADKAIKTYGDTAELIPKILYLRALSLGKVDVVDSLAVALKHIVSNYPGSEVKPMAQELLNVISKDRPDLASGTAGKLLVDTAFVSPYVYDSEGIHLYLLVIKRVAVKLNAMKVKISDHNKKYFSLEELTINSVLLDDNRYMITVGNFKNAQKALDYLGVTSGDPYVFSDLGSGNYTEAVISMKNYPIFYKEKDVDLYKRFYEIEYLNK